MTQHLLILPQGECPGLSQDLRRPEGMGPTQQLDCLEDVSASSVMTQKAPVLGPGVDGKASLLMREHLFFMVLVPPPLGPAQLPAWIPYSFVRAPSIC